jgi:hypothetical protein
MSDLDIYKPGSGQTSFRGPLGLDFSGMGKVGNGGGDGGTAYDQFIIDNYSPTYYLPLNEETGAATVAEFVSSQDGTLTDINHVPGPDFVSGTGLITDGDTSFDPNGTQKIRMLGTESWNPQAFTVLFWATVSASQTNRYMVCNWDGGGSFLINQQGGAVRAFVNDGSNRQIDINPGLLDFNPHLIALTVETNGTTGNANLWYDNGVKSTDRPLFGPISGSANPLTIAANASIASSQHFTGILGKVAIIPSALVQADIQAIYAAGTS